MPATMPDISTSTSMALSMLMPRWPSLARDRDANVDSLQAVGGTSGLLTDSDRRMTGCAD